MAGRAGDHRGHGVHGVCDGIQAGPEDCDGIDFGGETCVSQGFGGGNLGCNLAQCLFVTSGCTP